MSWNTPYLRRLQRRAPNVRSISQPATPARQHRSARRERLVNTAVEHQGRHDDGAIPGIIGAIACDGSVDLGRRCRRWHRLGDHARRVRVVRRYGAPSAVHTPTCLSERLATRCEASFWHAVPCAVSSCRSPTMYGTAERDKLGRPRPVRATARRRFCASPGGSARSAGRPARCDSRFLRVAHHGEVKAAHGQRVALPLHGPAQRTGRGTAVGDVVVPDSHRELGDDAVDFITAVHMHPEPRGGTGQVPPPPAEERRAPDATPATWGSAERSVANRTTPTIVASPIGSAGQPSKQRIARSWTR
jgi:hypothetical protein